MLSTKKALVYGGNGAMGRKLVETFVQHQWEVLSVDFTENKNATTNILLHSEQTTKQQSTEIVGAVLRNINQTKLSIIVNCAGGWQAGNVENLEKLFSTSQTMWEQSVASSLMCSHIASKAMLPDGVLVFFGANSALGPTPTAIGYGMAKSAVIQLTRSLASKDSGVSSQTLCLCPVILDTASNREAMPKADFSSWTPLQHIADQIMGYATHKDKFTSGSIVNVLTTGGKTKFEPVSL